MWVNRQSDDLEITKASCPKARRTRGHWTMLALASVVLSACAPVYSKSYEYQPISNPDGARCAVSCEVDKTHCLNAEQRNYQKCIDGPWTRNLSCYDKHNFDRCSWDPPTCDLPNFQRCEDVQADCHLNCGGKVMQKTKCSSYCEGARPPEDLLLFRPDKATLQTTGEKETLPGKKKRVR